MSGSVIGSTDRHGGFKTDLPRDCEALSGVPWYALAVFRQYDNYAARTFDGPLDELIAETPLTRSAVRLGRTAAKTRRHVLIVGQSGVGKRTFGVAIHRTRPSPRGSLVVIPCPAVPDRYHLPELFGGPESDVRSIGAVEEARGGLLLLLYAEELARDAQQQLASIAGTSPTDPRHVQIIVTCIRPEALDPTFVRALDPISIELPSLAERRADVLPLARLFFERSARSQSVPHMRLTGDAEAAIARRSYPGNVRELHNHIVRAIFLAKQDGVDEIGEDFVDL